MLEFPLGHLCASLQRLKSGVTRHRIATASSRYTLVLGSIASEASGVIQDPAGSAIGSGHAPYGGGLSGAIYRQFDLDPIPLIAVGEAVFNTSTEGRRILHTHSPHLGGALHIWHATLLMAQAYKNALGVFIEQCPYHQTTLFNLCAVSAGIYADRFTHPDYDHLDPTITQLALVAAICEIERDFPNALDDIQLRLFYFGSPAHPTQLFLKAQQVQQELQQI